MIKFCPPNFRENIIIILDGKFISINKQQKIKQYKKEIKEISAIVEQCPLICAFSSFPQSVLHYNRGDSTGEFNIIEINTNHQIISELSEKKNLSWRLWNNSPYKI